MLEKKTKNCNFYYKNNNRWLTREIMKSCAGATWWWAGRSGSGRWTRRSPSMVMVLLLLVVLVVVQEHRNRWFPLGTTTDLDRWRRWRGRRRRWPPSVVVPRTLVGHGSLPFLGHQAPGHGQPSSDVLLVADGAFGSRLARRTDYEHGRYNDMNYR